MSSSGIGAPAVTASIFIVALSPALNVRPVMLFAPFRVAVPAASYAFVKFRLSALSLFTTFSVPSPLSLMVTVTLYSVLSFAATPCMLYADSVTLYSNVLLVSPAGMSLSLYAMSLNWNDALFPPVGLIVISAGSGSGAFSVTASTFIVALSPALNSRPVIVFAPFRVAVPVALYAFVKFRLSAFSLFTTFSVPSPLSLMVTVTVYSLLSFSATPTIVYADSVTLYSKVLLVSPSGMSLSLYSMSLNWNDALFPPVGLIVISAGSGSGAFSVTASTFIVALSPALNSRPVIVFAPFRVAVPVASYAFVNSTTPTSVPSGYFIVTSMEWPSAFLVTVTMTSFFVVS